MEGDVVDGAVLEKLESKQYDYLRLQTSAGEAWVAVPPSSLASGEKVRVVGAMWLDDYQDPHSRRRWGRIAFGVLASRP